MKKSDLVITKNDITDIDIIMSESFLIKGKKMLPEDFARERIWMCCNKKARDEFKKAQNELKEILGDIE